MLAIREQVIGFFRRQMRPSPAAAATEKNTKLSCQRRRDKASFNVKGSC